MKITEALVVLFLVLFCYLFLDKFLFRGELGEIYRRDSGRLQYRLQCNQLFCVGQRQRS